MSIKMKTRGIDPLVASQAGTDESGFPQYNIQTPTLTSQGPDPTSGSKYKAITVKWDMPYMVNWSPPSLDVVAPNVEKLNPSNLGPNFQIVQTFVANR